MVFPLAALIGGLGSVASTVIGGMMAGNERRQAQKYQGGSLARVVGEAQRLGIHPSVALGSPISSQMATPVMSNAPDIVAGGLKGAADSFASGFDPLTQKQIELLDAQINNTNASTADLLSAARSRTVASMAAAAGRGGAVPSSTRLVTPLSEFDTSRTSTTAEFGKEYGDIAKEGYGLIRLLHDSLVNLGWDGGVLRDKPVEVEVVTKGNGPQSGNYWDTRNRGRGTWPY